MGLAGTRGCTLCYITGVKAPSLCEPSVHLQWMFVKSSIRNDYREELQAEIETLHDGRNAVTQRRRQ